MWLLQLTAYPASIHIEWPGSHGRGNSWTNAFFWIRDHTPRNAVFALDPDYMLSPGEDEHGFRAIAERSALADEVKDSGAVSLFPQLARDWEMQSNAQRGWRHFQRDDFERLASEYPVTWMVTYAPGPLGFFVRISATDSRCAESRRGNSRRARSSRRLRSSLIGGAMSYPSARVFRS